ncbi:hypothetical protein J1N35_004508 [Gossypium stocksii]|uniref:Uncharacterized protein n=1 Tax=Gossypium stocksii TaxID=47602 RepID=A0A9D3WCU5_9ROSI|nr:hypothetical protein J1N35_004508 [Gossypium stocksii]
MTIGIISKHHTSPVEAIFCSDTNQSMYCQLLAGLIQRDEVVMVGSQFATALLRAIKFLEGYWKELCSNIRSGQISDWLTDSGCKNAVSSIMKPNPQLADSIHKICRSSLICFCLNSFAEIKVGTKAKSEMAASMANKYSNTIVSNRFSEQKRI